MPNAPTQSRLREIPGWAVGLCLFGLTAGLCLIIWYMVEPPFLDKPSGNSEVALQFAATAEEARAIVNGVGGGDGDGDGGKLFQDGLVLDWRMFIPGYAVALAGAFGLGHLFLYRESARLWARRALALTPLPVVADCVENIFLWRALNRLAAEPVPDLAWASYFAQVKWALVVPLVAAAILIVVILYCRRVLDPSFVRSAREDRPRPVVAHAHRLVDGTESQWSDPDVILPPAAPHDWEPRAEWTAPDPAQPRGTEDRNPKDSAVTRWRTRAYQPPGRQPAELGFCVSGGGIRSASVTLGALQALRGQLLKATYLVSVSGGGYTAGAFQLALTDARLRAPDGIPSVRPALAKPADVFAPGSPEEDHIRRHAKYLADAPKEKLRAAGAVLRGMAVSFGMLALVFAVAGQFLHLFYSYVPLTELRPLAAEAEVFDSSLDLHPNAWRPVLVLFGLAGLVSVGYAFTRAGSGSSRPAWLRSTVNTLTGLALAVAAYSIVLPSVIWFFASLAQKADRGGYWDDSGAGVALLGAITAAATAAGTWFTAVHKTVKRLKPDGERAGPLARGGTSLVTQVGTS
ncbi:hypothetical protein ACFWCB_07600 [Streptomyces sp. NPDC060048]|uniref:hypothetical protein n=1 Tax=unclassified Streptomyces TaxID=2593676 RepID=UPI00369995DD